MRFGFWGFWNDYVLHIEEKHGTSDPDLFLVLVKHRPSRLFDKRQYFWRFHVEHFGNPSLHNQEMRVVDVQLDGLEKVLHPVVLYVGTIDQVLVLSANHNLKKIKRRPKCHFCPKSWSVFEWCTHLTGDDNFIVLLIALRALLLVSVIEWDWNRGLGDACLSVFVHQFLQISCPNLVKSRWTKWITFKYSRRIMICKGMFYKSTYSILAKKKIRAI